MVRPELAEFIERRARNSRLMGGMARLLTTTAPPPADDLFPWIQMANAGMLNRGNLHLIDLAVRGLPTHDPVVELGPFCGLSTNAIRRALDRHGRPNKLWCCDPWDYPRIASVMDPGAYNDFVKTTFQRAVEVFSGHELPHAVHSDSRAFFELWRRDATVTDVFGQQINAGGKIAFAYIDGEHDYENVAHDFALCNEFLVPGGFILFDDSSAASPFGVHRFVKDLLRGHSWKLVARNPNYLVQKRSAG